MLRSLTAIFFISICFLIPMFYGALLEKSVVTLGFGWVFTTILLRIIVILLFFIALKQIFLIFTKLSKIKTRIVFLIALLPGFSISFIAPIYTTDYGMFNDGFILENRDLLEKEIHADLLNQSGPTVIAFFTTTCPHCMAASERLGTNIEGGQKIKVNAIFPGDESDTNEFLEKHKGTQFRKHLLDNDSLFVTLSGGVFPSVFLLDNNGQTLNHWVGDELNYSALDYLKSFEQ